MNPMIRKYYRAAEDVAKVFTKKYFPEEEYGKDTYWIAGEIGGVYYVADRYYNMDRMIEAISLNATWEQLYEYEDAELEHALKDNGKPFRQNFKNFIKYGWIKGGVC